MAILAPHLAFSFMVNFLAHQIAGQIRISTALIQEKGSYEMLEVLHHVTSGFKAYCTDYAYVAMDEIR